MTRQCVLPVFEDDSIRSFLADKYQIQGELKRLDGERDLNYRITSADSRYVFKVANLEESPALLGTQAEVFDRINRFNCDLICPQQIPSTDGKLLETIETEKGERHYCRLVTYIDGKLFSSIKPHTPELLADLGKSVASLNLALRGYQSEAVNRPLLWNMMSAVQTVDQFLPLIPEKAKTNLVRDYCERFTRNVIPLSDTLPKSIIHNDVNDNNIIVDERGPWSQSVKSIIDFGDMVESWEIVDLAVACAYAMLEKPRPLDAAIAIVSGYHKIKPLQDKEIQVLFDLICMRLCISVCICAHQKRLEPDNDYLAVSEQPAWQALRQLKQLQPDFVHYALRDACGLDPVPWSRSMANWLDENCMRFRSIVDLNLDSANLLVLDTSVASPALPAPAADYDPQTAEKEIFRATEDANCDAAIGRYDEYRLIYSGDDFSDETGHRRTLHIGIDIFMPAGSSVFASFDGEIYGIENNDLPLDYGGTVILKHVANIDGREQSFYTLYGHLAVESVFKNKIGEKVCGGDKIAEIGTYKENGHWPAHVHFTVITDMLGEISTFVGVGSHQFRRVWKSLCIDPASMLGLDRATGLTGKIGEGEDADDILGKLQKKRAQSLNPSLSLSYRQPIHIVRGDRQYLYDYTGRGYLDAVNNVPHVGHNHPVVVEAGISQARVLNTNTRYLYQQINDYAEKLLTMFPRPLDVCYLVNSGSEANDLAMRLACNYSGRHNRLILDHAYHGNLSSLIDISPYKHNAAGGKGAPDHVFTCALPDAYRNAVAGENDALSQYFLGNVDQQIFEAGKHGGVSLFIGEAISGCGGQVVLPDGYLEGVYDRVRAVGGICIADEVQTGLGRIGSHIWAFESQNVVPDIVTLGKPLGNGHPLAAVITTREIADSFNNGMEYFNTFGGNPVSCAIGNAVLEVLDNENLQKNASNVGAELLKNLTLLKSRFPIIGDVRGRGLFLGMELVNDAETLEPAAKQASYIAERMKQEGILISTDGPLHNVLKIKPPMCFNLDNVKRFTSALEVILNEPYSKPTVY